jgi:hypothetical protein
VQSLQYSLDQLNTAANSAGQQITERAEECQLYLLACEQSYASQLQRVAAAEAEERVAAAEVEEGKANARAAATREETAPSAQSKAEAEVEVVVDAEVGSVAAPAMEQQAAAEAPAPRCVDLLTPPPDAAMLPQDEAIDVAKQAAGLSAIGGDRQANEAPEGGETAAGQQWEAEVDEEATDAAAATEDAEPPGASVVMEEDGVDDATDDRIDPVMTRTATDMDERFTRMVRCTFRTALLWLAPLMKQGVSFVGDRRWRCASMLRACGGKSATSAATGGWRWNVGKSLRRC